MFLWHFIEYVTVHSCRPIHHLRRLVRRSGSWTLRFEKFRLLLFNTLDFPTCYAYVKINYQQGLIVNSRKESLQHFKKPWAHDHEPVTGLLNAVKVSFFYPANSKCLHVDKNSQESFKFFSFSIIVMHRLWSRLSWLGHLELAELLLRMLLKQWLHWTRYAYNLFLPFYSVFYQWS